MVKIKLRTKIVGLIIASTTLVTFIVGMISISHIESQGKNEIRAFENESMQKYRSRLHDLTGVAYSLLPQYDEQASRGELSIKEAQSRAASRIGAMRYDNGIGYFWIQTCNPKYPDIPSMVMDPKKPELDGKILVNFVDMNEFSKIYYKDRVYQKNDPVIKSNIQPSRIFVEMNEMCAGNGEGFATYYWPKPTDAGVTEEGYLKMSYVKLYKPWGWVVGSGIYIDDIEREKAVKYAEIKNGVVASVKDVSLALALCLILGIFVALIVSRRLVMPITRLCQAAEHVSDRNYDVHVSITTNDEIGELSDAFNRMTGIIKERATMVADRTARLTETNKQLEENIAERKKLEEDRRRSEAWFKDIVFSMSDCIWETDVHGVYTYCSDRIQDIIGYTPEEMIGKKSYDFMPEDEAVKVGKILREIVKRKQPINDLENWNIHKDGSRVCLLTNGVPKFDPDGKLIGYRGVDKDITLRKRSEAYLMDREWLKTGMAELGDEMRGLQDIVTLGQNIITFLAEYLNAQIGAIYVADDENRLRLVGTYAFDKPDNFSSDFNSGEGLVGQAALGKKRVILTSIPDDYLVIRAGLCESVPRNIVMQPFLYENNVKGVLELGSLYEFSERGLDFLKRAAGNIAISIHSAQSSQRMQELLEKTQLQAEELQSQQEELRVSNEELEEQAQRLEEQKEAIQKKNAELERSGQIIEKKAKDLETTGRYKSEFLANMSHELRTPLNSILLLARLLSDNKEGNLTEEQMKFADTVYGAGSDLLGLINDILDLTKVEAGKIDLHVEDVVLKGVASDMEQNFQHIAQEKGLAFSTKMTDGLPAFIHTDRQRIEQILKNLLSNAFKFTPKGSVTFTIDRPDKQTDLSVSGLDPEKALTFSVADTGAGVPEDKQKLIFEPFEQADGTTSRKFGGTGLGLSISRELARLLGGEIRLHSEPGKGSVFTLYLPEALEGVRMRSSSEEPEKIKRQEATRDQQQDIGNRQQATSTEFIPDDRKDLLPGDISILIIEDEPEFAKILRNLSREKGFKVLVAEDGETGLHFADYYKPSAIILDIGLPGIDGWAVMSRLKGNPETRHIPIHFMTASDKRHDAIRMGAVSYLTKPVNMEELNQVYEKIEHMISSPVKNLLVVEADKARREDIIRIIGNGDVLITAVSTGQEAYEQLTSGKYDCIVLDVGLPDMSGVELLSKIRNNKDLLLIPIIVYTGEELTRREQVTLDKYAETIIIKGVKSPEKLLEETMLFLHRIEDDLPEERKQMLRMIHDKESTMKDKKILVVDDDMRNVYALQSILKQKGMKILVGQNGKEGLECLDKNPDVDLVLMDIMMPEMDGYEATREIRKQERFKNLPIIALTAKAMKGDRAKCIESGTSDYLAKPVNVDKLLSMLRVWLY